MHPADELRALAKRYRILAELGPPSHRENRLRWAEHLDQQAEQLQPRTINAIHAAVAAGVI
jgi:hypothetical protein